MIISLAKTNISDKYPFSIPKKTTENFLKPHKWPEPHTPIPHDGEIPYIWHNLFKRTRSTVWVIKNSFDSQGLQQEYCYNPIYCLCLVHTQSLVQFMAQAMIMHLCNYKAMPYGYEIDYKKASSLAVVFTSLKSPAPKHPLKMQSWPQLAHDVLKSARSQGLHPCCVSHWLHEASLHQRHQRMAFLTDFHSLLLWNILPNDQRSPN